MCAVLQTILEANGGLAVQRHLYKDQENFSVKGQIVNVLVFEPYGLCYVLFSVILLYF